MVLMCFLSGPSANAKVGLKGQPSSKESLGYGTTVLYSSFVSTWFRDKRKKSSDVEVVFIHHGGFTVHWCLQRRSDEASRIHTTTGRLIMSRHSVGSMSSALRRRGARAGFWRRSRLDRSRGRRSPGAGEETRYPHQWSSSERDTARNSKSVIPGREANQAPIKLGYPS